MLTKYCNQHKMFGQGTQVGVNQGQQPMQFGEKVRELRKAKNLTQRDLADKVKVNFTYISKIENGKLDFGNYPSDDLIRKLAKALGANADELLLRAEKIPDQIKKRVMQRPDAFRKFANLDDRQIDGILKDLDDG